MTHKFVRALGLLLSGALVAGGTLLGSAGTAQAAAPKKITKVTAVATPNTVDLPAGSATADVVVSVTFNGAVAEATDANGDGYTVSYAASTAKGVGPAVSSATKIKQPVLPKLVAVPAAATLTSGTAAAFKVRVASTTTPGKYTLNVPITQTITKVATGKASRKTKVAKATFTVKANTEYSANNTDLVSMKGRAGKKLSVHVTAPTYTYGAKVTVYYAKSGSTSFTAVGSGKVNNQGVAKFKTKSGKIRSAGSVYLTIGKLGWSDTYDVGYWTLSIV
jgi:hypothetical protein